MINLQIDEEYKELINEEPLRLAALTVLAHQEKPVETEINIVITDNSVIQQLNKEYRDIDSPTDVLSFISDVIDPETDTPILGDILISYTYALAQSKEYKHDLIEELQLLVTHGCLHLCGYGHVEDTDKAIMWKAQDEILSAIDVKARP